MSVQNLREKFNQSSNGTLAAPGTSFGASQFFNRVQENGFSKNGINDSKIAPIVNLKSPSQFMPQSTKSYTSDRPIIHNVKTVFNGENFYKNSRKSPEQCQQDLILRKWSMNSLSNDDDSNNNNNNNYHKNNGNDFKNHNSNLYKSDNNNLINPKTSACRFTTCMALEPTINGTSNNCDMNNTIAESTEKFKNIYESNNSANKFNNTITSLPLNGNVKNSVSHFNVNGNGIKTDFDMKCTNNDTKYNNSFLHSNVNRIGNLTSSRVAERCRSEPEKSVSHFQSSHQGFQEYSDLQKKYDTLKRENEDIIRKYNDMNNQFTLLRKVSEAMYKEYNRLQNQYEIETNTMQQAIERASEWYKQNRELKRKSSALIQHVISVKPDYLSEMKDDVVDSLNTEHDSEIEVLRKTIKDLTKEVSKLQAELNSLRNVEADTQDHIAELNNLLTLERKARAEAETKLKKISNTQNPGNHEVEEKLKTTEVELSTVTQRAQHAELQMTALLTKVSDLENELSLLKSNATQQSPPPPPPPPPPLTASNYTLLKKSNKIEELEGSAADQMADLLGIPKKNIKSKVQGGAIDDIINEIKGGRFTLKATEKLNSVNKKEEPPPVVNEMRNILGTLRRQPNRRVDVDNSTIHE